MLPLRNLVYIYVTSKIKIVNHTPVNFLKLYRSSLKKLRYEMFHAGEDS